MTISHSLSTAVVVLVCLIVFGAPLAAKDTLVFVGTYSKGIQAFTMNQETGELTPLGPATDTASASSLAVHQDRNRALLVAVNEVGNFKGQPTGAVTLFAMHRAVSELFTQLPKIRWRTKHPRQAASTHRANNREPECRILPADVRVRHGARVFDSEHDSVWRRTFGGGSY